MLGRKDIERAAAVLIGKRLWRCTRAANMTMFDFGDRITVEAFKGHKKLMGEVVLHVQCAWRIVHKDEIIVGSRDLQYPADYSETQEVPADFDWDRDPNRQDKLLAALLANDATNLIVREIKGETAGRFEAILSEGFSLQVFPDDSLSLEHWRLFTPRSQRPHFVVSGESS